MNKNEKEQELICKKLKDITASNVKHLSKEEKDAEKKNLKVKNPEQYLHLQKMYSLFEERYEDLNPEEIIERKGEILKERLNLINQIQNGEFKERMEANVGFKEEVVVDKKTTEELLLEEVETLNVSIELLANQIEELSNKKSLLERLFISALNFFRIVFW